VISIKKEKCLKLVRTRNLDLGEGGAEPSLTGEHPTPALPGPSQAHEVKETQHKVRETLEEGGAELSLTEEHQTPALLGPNQAHKVRATLLNPVRQTNLDLALMDRINLLRIIREVMAAPGESQPGGIQTGIRHLPCLLIGPSCPNMRLSWTN
jgi:hypothetical protein